VYRRNLGKKPKANFNASVSQKELVSQTIRLGGFLMPQLSK
jgi:hypothetical protein